MIKQLTHVNVWVHDQDEALAFYTQKLGMELRDDVTLPELGGFRWLTVGPVGQPDIALALMAPPGPPVFDADTADAAPGADGQGRRRRRSSSRPTTAAASYEELKARGVEFSEEPSERPYGIDAAFRDPSGNSIRLVQSP